MKDLRDVIGGVPIGHRDRELRVSEFSDMTMAAMFLFLPDDAEFIKTNYSGSYSDDSNVGEWLRE
jgi:hypothetical protein